MAVVLPSAQPTSVDLTCVDDWGGNRWLSFIGLSGLGDYQERSSLVITPPRVPLSLSFLS